jgi:hypothetical protein
VADETPRAIQRSPGSERRQSRSDVIQRVTAIVIVEFRIA